MPDVVSNPSVVSTVQRLIDRLSESVLTFILTMVLSTAVLLLGATGGGFLGVPPNGIDGSWRLGFGVFGAALILTSLWKYLRGGDSKSASLVKQTNTSMPIQSDGSLLITSPKIDARTRQVDRVVGEAVGQESTQVIEFAGTVFPAAPEMGVWVLRRKVAFETAKGHHRKNELFVYPAVLSNDGVWRCNIYVGLGSAESRREYEIWGVVPSRDAALLFKYHRVSRLAIDEAAKALKVKSPELKWTGPRVPLPSDYDPTALASSQPVRVVLRRG